MIVSQACVSLILDGCDSVGNVNSSHLDYMNYNWIRLICKIQDSSPLVHIPFGWDSVQKQSKNIKVEF